MDKNEKRSEQKPSSAMVRDATRLRAVMGVGDSSRRLSSDLPYPEEPQTQEHDRICTRLRFADVADTPPSTLAAVTAAPESSATRIAPPKPDAAEPDIEKPVPVRSASNQPRPVLSHNSTAAAAPAKTITAPSSAEYLRSASSTYASRSAPSRGWPGFIAVGAIGLGLVVGVAVWAGVGSQITSLFSESNPEAPVDYPARVTETPASLTSPEAIDSVSTSQTASVDDPSTATSTHEDLPQVLRSETPYPASAYQQGGMAAKHIDRPKERGSHELRESSRPVAESHSVRSQLPDEASDASAARESLGAAGEETRGEPSVRAATPSSASAAPREEKRDAPSSAGEAAAQYTVQVRSTTNRREAEGIAERLRDKGARSVRVEAWKKGGIEMFRVRYGRYESSGKARSEADRLGQSDVWIVRDRPAAK